MKSRRIGPPRLHPRVRYSEEKNLCPDFTTTEERTAQGKLSNLHEKKTQHREWQRNLEDNVRA